MTTQQKIDRDGDPSRTARAESSVEEARGRLAGLLPEDALQDALRGLEPEEITGPGGLLSELAGRVIETALGAELSEHLGYPPGEAPTGGAGNHRNGTTAKTLQTELGPVAVRTPRDRNATFEPQLVGKRQTRLAGLDEKILGLYAGGMTVRDISAHLSELYGVEVGRDTISRVTDAVLEDVEAWRTRPLDQVYPIVYFDALRVKVREDRSVRNLACYLALGVTCDGEREVLGIWWQETEGSKFWLAVLNDLHRRGVTDVLIACVDGLKGFPEAILAAVEAWRTRPWDQMYPIVYFDALRVKVREDRSVRNLACYLALGVTCDGEREVLGIWWQETEGAKFWLAVLNDLRRRGVSDVLISCVDGLKGFPEAIEATFPQAWVQTCIVHLIRASLRYVNYRDLKKVTSALRPIYTAANADQALVELERFDQQWGDRYPATVRAWRDAWEHVTPFLALPEELRKAVYTTNTIEGLHRQIRKAIKTRGHFPDQQAATKLIYLAIIKADAKWQRNRTWSAPRAALKIHFGDRYPG